MFHVEQGSYPLRLTTFASSPKGTPLRYAGNFIATTKSRPLGEGGLPRSGKTEGVNSLSQNLTVLPAPSEREPLAKPHTLHLSRKLSRYAKGPIFEGAVIAQR